MDFISVDSVHVIVYLIILDIEIKIWVLIVVLGNKPGCFLIPVGLDLNGISVIACVVRAGCVMIDCCATYSSVCFCFCEVFRDVTLSRTSFWIIGLYYIFLFCPSLVTFVDHVILSFLIAV